MGFSSFSQTWNALFLGFWLKGMASQQDDHLLCIAKPLDLLKKMENMELAMTLA